MIRVVEQDAGSCGEPTRTQTPGDLSDVGDVGGGTRAYDLAVSDTGGEFALEADVIALRVTAVPATGVVGKFDIAVDLSYTAPVRSYAG